jgi:polyisoprenoid-binding protein YceI
MGNAYREGKKTGSLGFERTAVSGSAKINRQDFGVAWNKTLDAGGVVVGDEVNITLDVEMVIPPTTK